MYIIRMRILMYLPYSIIQAASPQFCTISRDVNTGSTISMTLELPHQRLIVKIPYRYITV